MNARGLAILFMPLSLAAAEDRTPREEPLRSARRLATRETDALRDPDIVIGVVVGGVARAYPVKDLWYPEGHVVNDTVADTPITATWCPLALSGAVFDRKLQGRTVELGAIDEPDNGILQLYDTATHSRWNQVAGRAVSGPLAGTALQRRGSLITTWGRWKASYPETTVYLRDPPGGAPVKFNEELLAQIVLTSEGPPRDEDWVAGLSGSRAAAVLVRRLTQERVGNENWGDRPIVAFLTEDLTTVTVWERSVEGRTLTFRAERDQMRDVETGSSWDAVTGRAVAGPLAGRRLAGVVTTTTTWRAWKAQFPDSLVFGEPPPR